MPRTVLGIPKPRVKLLNIGTEELKGTDELKEAAALLREADYLPFRFDGFTEGDQLSRGEVDVVVTDGFSGNIALKTAEGTARFVTDLLRRAFKSSLRSKAGFALSRPALNLLKVHLDPNNHNGAVFLGLNGLVVKSHGSANRQGRRQRDPRRRAAWSATTSPGRSARTSTISAPTPSPTRPRNEPALGRPRRRQRAARAREVTNEELAETVDTTDEWIVERTGIRSRYIAGDGETTATLATDAARTRARPCRASTPTDIDLIVLATATPDQTFPSSATKVQAALGIDDCIAFDVHAVCTGFLYALSVADSMLRSGNADKALVIGAETFSRILDWEDRATCVLFGDGAGALVLERRGDRERHPRHQAPRRRPPQRSAVRRRRPLDHRHRRQAADEGPRGVPPRRRQPRRRAERSARRGRPDRRPTSTGSFRTRPMRGSSTRRRRKLGLPPEKVVVTVDQHANTSAASVPLAFDTAVKDGRIKRGDLVVLEAMGGGFTWGAAALRY